MTEDDGLVLYQMMKKLCDVIDILLGGVSFGELGEEAQQVLVDYGYLRHHMRGDS